jgi:PAS domain S-box-containing protein
MAEATCKILLVEDEDAHIELIRRAFSARAERVVFHIAHTLEEASSFLKKHDYDLVLIDFLLPDGKGIELLPTNKEEAECPFMLMTSHGDEKLAVDALKAGALDYVVKSAENLAAMPTLIKRALREWNLIQERRQAEEALRLSEEKFRTIADYSMDLGIWLGVDGELVWANRSIERMTGYTFEECLKNPEHIFALAHEEDRPEIQEMFNKALAEKTSGTNVPFRLKCKNGFVLWVSVSWQPIFSTLKGYLGIRASIRDIHELKKTLEKLEEANRELDAFVYTVSHDLRTPLTPIIGYAQVLRTLYEKGLDEKAKKYLLVIEQQGEKMLHLLEDLLLLARAGSLERPSTPVNAEAVVREIASSLNGHFIDQQSNIEIKKLPTVHLPKTLLAQVFENLIKNALTYAGETKEPIEIGGERTEGKACYYIRDHGRGVSDSEKTKIFEVFYRGTAKEQTEGSGIGLATVRKIARQYGGTAWVEDTPGGGATFWFSVEDFTSSDKLA